MADAVYEYTDAQGRTHQVDDLSKVPKDRLRHMVVIGTEEQETSTGQPVPAAPPAAPKSLPPEVWAVSGVLFLIGAFSKKFLLRVLCISVAVLYLLYSGWDIFQASDLAKTAERKPKPRPAAPDPDAE